MSLDVYLNSKEKVKKTCGCCDHEYEDYERIYNSNITHNLGKMAKEAGIYEALWRPEEIGIDTASQLIEPLTAGLKKMKDNPGHYKKFDAENGWGLYIHFVPFVEEYLNACIFHPDASVTVSR